MYRAIAVAGATLFWLGLTGCAITRDGMFFKLHASGWTTLTIARNLLGKARW